MTIYAATTNPGKLREFSKCAGEQGVEVLALPGVEFMPEPVEDAATFEGNAEKKAVEYSKLAPGLLVFADDSGLEVDALGGEPGVRSARFADDLGFELGQGSKDERNNRAVLSLLKDLSQELEADGGVIVGERGARFVCVLVLAKDGEVMLRARGEVEGQILDAPRGTDGFGYDPLFLLPESGKTLAEVSPEEKWAVSHRGNAFRELLTQLKDFAQNGR